MVSAHWKQAVCGAVVGTALALPAHAAELNWSPTDVARCIAKAGAPSVKQGAASRLLDLKGTLQQGDTVDTGKQGAARLLLRDGSVLDLAHDTTLQLQAFKQADGAQKPSVRLKTLLGRLWAHIMPRSEPDFVVEGANAIAGVRGTSFFMEVQDGKTTVVTESGSVNVKGPSGSDANVGPLQQLQVSNAKGPLTVTTLSVGDLQRMRDTMHIGSSMEAGSGQRLVQTTQQQHAANNPPQQEPQHAAAPPASAVIDRGVPTTTLNTVPTLNIDPGARLTHVKARVELRQ